MKMKNVKISDELFYMKLFYDMTIKKYDFDESTIFFSGSVNISSFFLYRVEFYEMPYSFRIHS